MNTITLYHELRNVYFNLVLLKQKREKRPSVDNLQFSYKKLLSSGKDKTLQHTPVNTDVATRVK